MGRSTLPGRFGWLPACLSVLSLAAAACTAPNPASSPNGRRVIQVVAAESFWGSIAGQIGGAHVQVTSVITKPSADPHSYEPTTGDARAVALAQMVIVNGIGYDPWMSRLLAADSGKRTVLTVGHLLGVPAGANPHRWYNPSDVQTVIAAIVSDYARLDPPDAQYFRDRWQLFNSVDLREYESLISLIRSRYAGTPVGASESIFSMLAPALGLDVVTPSSFLKAISEGTDVSPADKARIDTQIRHHLIKIYVYNSQNTTPDVRAQLRECNAAGVPTAVITETLSPASASYEAWQVRQLNNVLSALQEAQAR